MELVERAVPKTEAPPSVDVPLGPEEMLEMKRHLRFLRDYKKVLKLKLNAQEDLMLNGAREPSSRGVCQHLLAKVEYSLVAAAATRMEKADRPRLLAGVLGFKTDLAFLLLYLECLTEAAHDGATAALEQALERIDFKSVSEGQMRRVLELISALFDEGQRATLMLGLLASGGFRSAFDQSLAKLPDALGSVMAPLRAVHAVVLEGRRNPLDDATLARGVELLLRGEVRAFERRPEAIRERLLRVAVTRVPAAFETHSAALQRLLDGFKPDSALRAELELLMVRRWIGAGQTQRAEKRLGAFVARHPEHEAAKLLARALAAPRFGHLALLEGGQQPPVQHLNAALDVLTQRPLWLRVGTAADAARIDEEATLGRELLLPGVARPVKHGAERGLPLIAYPRSGELLTRRHPTLRDPRSALQLGKELVSIAAALAQRGLALPDLGTRRFEVNSGVELVLVNPWQATRSTVAESERVLLASAKAELSASFLRHDADRRRLEAADGFAALFDLLDELQWSEDVTAPRSSP